MIVSERNMSLVQKVYMLDITRHCVGKIKSSNLNYTVMPSVLKINILYIAFLTFDDLFGDERETS